MLGPFSAPSIGEGERKFPIHEWAFWVLRFSNEVESDGMELLQREYPTAIGPVDLLCRAADGGTVAVEIKRRGGIDGVEQITRYLDLLRQDTRLHPVRGMFVAQLIAPQAKVLAMSRNIECLEVDFDRLRGIEPSDLRLF